MSTLTHLKPAYAIAGGDTDFPAMQVKGSQIMVTTELQDLNTSDASLELHQSIDASEWGLIPDSNQVLTAGQTSHHWNVGGLVSGAYVRVSLKKGTATAGTINAIKMLGNE